MLKIRKNLSILMLIILVMGLLAGCGAEEKLSEYGRLHAGKDRHFDRFVT